MYEHTPRGSTSSPRSCGSRASPTTRGQFSFPRRCSHLSPADPLLDLHTTDERSNKGKVGIKMFNLQLSFKARKMKINSNSDINFKMCLISMFKVFKKEVWRPAPVQPQCNGVPLGQDQDEVHHLREGHQGGWGDAGRRLRPVSRPRQTLVRSQNIVCSRVLFSSIVTIRNIIIPC